MEFNEIACTLKKIRIPVALYYLRLSPAYYEISPKNYLHL